MGISASYADLRNQQIEILDSSKIPFKKRVRHLGRKILGEKVTHWIVSRNKKPIDMSQLSEMEREFVLAQEKGYAYHQERYKTDPALREWVHRKKYL
jgi:hypothetical protein